MHFVLYAQGAKTWPRLLLLHSVFTGVHEKRGYWKRCASCSSERHSVLPKGTQLGSIRTRIPTRSDPDPRLLALGRGAWSARSFPRKCPQAPPSKAEEAHGAAAMRCTCSAGHLAATWGAGGLSWIHDGRPPSPRHKSVLVSA